MSYSRKWAVGVPVGGDHGDESPFNDGKVKMLRTEKKIMFKPEVAKVAIRDSFDLWTYNLFFCVAGEKK